MKHESLYCKAESLKGCLSHLRTQTGRRRWPQKPGIFRLSDPFMDDEQAILLSKAYRNMAHKTQVFTEPTNGLIRNRMNHTNEVVANAVILADMLGLNVSLARAIAQGHDIGHVPFGHQGEKFLAKAMGKPAFCHEVMGVIIAQKIERIGKGLNLMHETLEGMESHSGNRAKEHMTPEAWCVRYVDKVAYFFHDYNDFERRGFKVSKKLRRLVDSFGHNQRRRTRTALAGLMIESANKGKVRFEDSELARQFKELRTLMYEMYERVNRINPTDCLEPALDYVIKVAKDRCNPFLLFALMNDNDIIGLTKKKPNMRSFKKTSGYEMLTRLEKIGPIDMCDPDLDW